MWVVMDVTEPNDLIGLKALGGGQNNLARLI